MSTWNHLHASYLLVNFLFVIIFTGCTFPSQSVETAVNTNTPAPPTATASATPTPAPAATAIPTPTRGPLEPADLFDTVSPYVAFIESTTGRGSALLMENKYLLTNAHVTWPYESVRVVFSDGAEYESVPVVNIDQMTDLAVLGPIDTELSGLPLVDGESMVVGSDAYLIGYPGEVDKFPQPTITRGLISRVREWEPLEITYFQSDATIAGGQSGGVLVSELGDVIGISSHYFSEAGFALVASAADIEPRVAQLIALENVSGLEDWRLPFHQSGRTDGSLFFDYFWENKDYLIVGDVSDNVDLSLEGDTDGKFVVTNLNGEVVLEADASFSGRESGTFRINYDAPYFLNVTQMDFEGGLMNLRSSHELIPLAEGDGRVMELGDTLGGRIDFPGELDFYRIDVEKGDAINVRVSSMLIDPFILIMPDRPFLEEEVLFDDDSGRGVVGLDAELSFIAPQSGRYLILVRDQANANNGGYFITIDTPYDGAPTPIPPPPTPESIASDFGRMSLYEDLQTEYSFQYPTNWQRYRPTNAVELHLCESAKACFSDFNNEVILVYHSEDLAQYGLESFSLDDYADYFAENTQTQTLADVDRAPFTTSSGLSGEVQIVRLGEDGEFTLMRLITLDDSMGLTLTLFSSQEVIESRQSLIEYIFSTVAR